MGWTDIESPIKLMNMCLDGARNLERTHVDTGHTNSTQKGLLAVRHQC